MNPVQALAVAAVSLALVVGQALGLFGGGSPSMWSPAPFLLVIPALMGVPVFAANPAPLVARQSYMSFSEFFPRLPTQVGGTTEFNMRD